MIRLFPGNIKGISKKRSSFALMCGTGLAILILSYGKQCHPPAYPVAPMDPLSAQEVTALLDEMGGISVPEDLPLAMAQPFIDEWSTAPFIETMRLSPPERTTLNERLLSDPLDPLVPGLVALAKREKQLGVGLKATQHIQDFLAKYPIAGTGPDCTTRQQAGFSGFVCSHRQAFHRMATQRSIFKAWFNAEKSRHQFGSLWNWAWWRTHSNRRVGLFIHNQMSGADYWNAHPEDTFIEDINTVTDTRDTKTPYGIAQSGTSPILPSGLRPSDVIGSGSTAPLIPLESQLVPLWSLSCGALFRTAQIQVVPMDENDSDVMSLCRAELARRASTETQLQIKYVELLQLRNEALHNKNMLQFLAWRAQRNTIAQVIKLFDEVVTLEANSMPQFSLVVFEQQSVNEMNRVLDDISKTVSQPPSNTLFALTTYPAVSNSEDSLSVSVSPKSNSEYGHWIIEAGTEQEAHIRQKGNVVFLDAQASHTLQLLEAKDDRPDLWARCFETAKLDEPTTWCTEYQWSTLTLATARPGRIHQLLHGALKPGELGQIPWVEPGALAFWGSGMRHGPEGGLHNVVTGSAPVTLYEFLTTQSMQPKQLDWAYPSVMEDLR